MKNAKIVEAVCIYIYIGKFNKIQLCKHKETMSF